MKTGDRVIRKRLKSRHQGTVVDIRTADQHTLTLRSEWIELVKEGDLIIQFDNNKEGAVTICDRNELVKVE